MVSARFFDAAVIDGRYRVGHPAHFDFVPKFFEHAAAGTLPAVAWIDPNFVDVGSVDNANDDHPPTDILHAQELVLEVYNALLNSPQWNETMLVITYDEHGGFFDHVAPPAAADDLPAMRHYGVRVPAVVVSPWVKPASVVDRLRPHVDHQDHPAPVLPERERQYSEYGRACRRRQPSWFSAHRTRPAAVCLAGRAGRTGDPPANATGSLQREPVPVGVRRAPNEFQREVAAAKSALAAEGQPPGTP